jgi:DNA polymerase III subunit alpha
VSDQFVHLHVHSEYSMLDGAAKVKPLIARAEELGMPAVAITDHGNMFGAAEFYREAIQTSVKPIIGIEAYVAPASRFHKEPVFWGARRGQGQEEFDESADVSGRGAYTHMTMLAANATGLRNLIKLSSLASLQGQYRKPRMDRELIAEHATGIIATTGCPGGEVATRLRLGQWDEALTAAAEYMDIFGEENYFVELMDHGIPMERRLREDLLRLADTLGLRTVVTNDSHYVTADQKEAHAALLCVQTGRTLSDPKRFAFDGEGYWLKSAEEMRAQWDSEVPGACDATLEIADRIESYAEVFAHEDRMPRVEVSAGKTESDMLREEVEHYTPARFPDGLPEEYRQRVEYELDVICSKGYAGYFLMVGDLVRWAEAQGIRVGPGRGSAAGSLVSYILRIVKLDPIKHTLLFERFLNPERDSPPDIDLDFDVRRRGEVDAYVKDKYGSDNFAQLVTFNTIKTKAALKDAARSLFGQPGYTISDRITRALPRAIQQVDIPLRGIVDPDHERYGEAAEVRGIIESKPDAKRIYDLARGLEGLMRGTGVHACGRIVSSKSLLDTVPLFQRADGSIITGWDYQYCEDIGLLKMDLLGVAMLTIIDDTVKAVQANHGVELDLEALPLDDSATYELLSRGDTLGVFQLDSAGIRQMLRAMAPKRFDDISAGIALYRPGPMAMNAHMDYAARSNGRAPVRAIHPDLYDALDPILGSTYHLIVFQEQVMTIAQQLAGYTMGQADLLRKAMGKKRPEVIAKEAERFLGGMKERGYSDEAATKLWEVMLPFAGYAFNKSHSEGYAILSYWTAYLKAHYPAEFMAAQLTQIAKDKAKSAIYLAECRRMGVKVLPPDVNESRVDFSAVNGSIRFGLSAIRNVGTGVAEAILRSRSERGPAESFADFLEKADRSCCGKRVVESLIKAGAFDSFGQPRMSLLNVSASAAEAVAAVKKKQEAGQFDLFGGDDGESTLDRLEVGDEEWPRLVLLAFEREMLGLYVSGHPLDGTEAVLRRYAPKTIAWVLDEAPPGDIVVSGMISSVDRRTNKKGEPWAIVTLEDLDASIEVLFFPRSYVDVAEELVPDAVVAIKGRVNVKEEESSGAPEGEDAPPAARIVSVFGDGIIPLDVSSTQAAEAPPLVVRVNALHIDADAVTDLKSSLVAHAGDTPVRVVLSYLGKETQWRLDEYPVNVSSTLVGELRSIPGISVEL